jgi:hypothetical protein
MCLFYVSVTRTPPPDPFPAPLDDGKLSRSVLSCAHCIVSFVSLHGVKIECIDCLYQQAYFKVLLILSTITVHCGYDSLYYGYGHCPKRNIEQKNIEPSLEDCFIMPVDCKQWLWWQNIVLLCMQVCSLVLLSACRRNGIRLG